MDKLELPHYENLPVSPCASVVFFLGLFNDVNWNPFSYNVLGRARNSMMLGFGRLKVPVGN